MHVKTYSHLIRVLVRCGKEFTVVRQEQTNTIVITQYALVAVTQLRHTARCIVNSQLGRLFNIALYNFISTLANKERARLYNISPLYKHIYRCLQWEHGNKQDLPDNCFTM